jgi:hypothetical protein
MSSGGPNGSTLSGLTGMVIRDASDVIAQTKLRTVYTTNVPAASGYTGVNSYRSKGVQNSYSFITEIQKGLRECGINGVPVAGNAFGLTPGTTKNLANTSVTIPSTIPVKN